VKVVVIAAFQHGRKGVVVNVKYIIERHNVRVPNISLDQVFKRYVLCVAFFRPSRQFSGNPADESCQPLNEALRDRRHATLPKSLCQEAMAAKRNDRGAWVSIGSGMRLHSPLASKHGSLRACSSSANSFSVRLPFLYALGEN